MPRVNYVIACWMGERTREDPRQLADRSFFVRAHLERLGVVQNEFDQTTIVMATGGDPIAEERVRELVRGTPTVLLERANSGFSYGSWNHAFGVFGEEFTHYVFVEDDYIPAQNNPRARLLALAREDSLVCGLASHRHTNAAISLCVAPSCVLREVLPAPVDPDDSRGYQTQMVWSRAFHDKGYPVNDWTETHSSPFWEGWRVVWYGHPALPVAFVPIQAIRREPTFIRSVRGEQLCASINEAGIVEPVSIEDAEVWEELLATSPDDEMWQHPTRWAFYAQTF